MLSIVLTALYVVVCLLLVAVVLMQQGKGGDIAAAFGGSGSQTAFGARAGATVLTRATTVMGVVLANQRRVPIRRIGEFHESIAVLLVPLMFILLVFLGIGPISRWKSTSVGYLRQQLTLVAIVAVGLGIILPLVVLMDFSLAATLALVLAFWLVLSMLRDIMNKVRNKPDLVQGLRSLTAGYWGMQLAHFGVALLMVGAVLTSNFSVEKSVLLRNGDMVDLGDYHFEYSGTVPVTGPNYIGDVATITVYHKGEFLRELHPEKRIYLASSSPSTEMAIDAGFLRDLFITLGERRDDVAWSMTIYIKPFVRWVWLGAIFMALGGLTAALDRRYRRLRVRDQKLAQERAGHPGADLQPAS